MKIRIIRSTDYLGEEAKPVESFCLEVEKEVGDSAEATADMYLKLREMLIAGLKKEDK